MSNTSSDPTGSNWRSNYAPAGYQFIPNVGIETSAPITNMSNMLEYNSSINDPDISSWDVSTVTDMQYMFSSGSSFNQPLSSWDVSNVTNMQSMFQGAASFNQDLSSWDVSSVATMSSMLTTTDAFNNGGVALGGTFAATVGNHTNDLSSMFNGSGFNQNINSWNISAVTNFSGMFSASRFNNGGTPLTWVWPAWSNLSYLFSGRDGNLAYADGITMDITGWDVSGVSNMSYMFSGARNFNQNISVWDVGNVNNMSGMFYENWNAAGALNFNQDLSGWDVSWVSRKPTNFYSGSNTPHPSWTLPKPVWGTDGQG
jgi:surface protein